METTGWVSFNWMAYSSGNAAKSFPCFCLYWRRISWRDALEKKYCCFKRRRFPLSVSSFGYSTLEIASASSRSRTARSYFCSLNSWKSNPLTGSACQRRSVLIRFPPYPMTGISYGTAYTCWFLNSTSTFSLSRRMDHGSPNRCQSSAVSRWNPFSKYCLNRPYL